MGSPLSVFACTVVALSTASAKFTTHLQSPPLPYVEPPRNIGGCEGLSQYRLCWFQASIVRWSGQAQDGGRLETRTMDKDDATGPLLRTPFGMGELVGRSHQTLKIKLLWGAIILVRA